MNTAAQTFNPFIQHPAQEVALRRLRGLCALIIEDDVDVALMVDEALRKNGWITNVVTNFNDAKKSITALRPNLVILDWYLDNHHRGGEVIEYYDKIRSKFDEDILERNPMQIVTFSSAPTDKLDLPRTLTCLHIDHWKKPMSTRELFHHVADLTAEDTEFF